MDELVKLFKRSSKLTLLSEITIENNTLKIKFNPERGGVIYATLGENGGVDTLKLPRRIFPKFEGDMVTSNFKNERDFQMMNAIGLLYNGEFMLKLLRLIESNEEDQLSSSSSS